MVLEEVGASSIWGKEAKAILKEAKCYLKTDFKRHVGPEERCVDHCTGFSLSDLHNDALAQHCDHTHDMSCPSCSQLDEVLSNVTMVLKDSNAATHSVDSGPFNAVISLSTRSKI